MYYRLTIDLAFTDPDPINDIIDKARDHINDAIIINPHLDNEERGFILLQMCYHDETPTKPCEIISSEKVDYP